MINNLRWWIIPKKLILHFTRMANLNYFYTTNVIIHDEDNYLATTVGSAPYVESNFLEEYPEIQSANTIT